MSPDPAGTPALQGTERNLSSPYSLFPHSSVGKLKLDGGEKTTMQIKAETGRGKKHNRFAFILRRQWVGK